MVEDNDNEQTPEQEHNPEIYIDKSDQNTWIPTGQMVDLPTQIFRKNLLLTSTRKTILQNEPRNKEISFTPPDMDRKVWSQMSHILRKYNRDIRWLLYRFFSNLHPIDNSLRLIYTLQLGKNTYKETKSA